MRIRTIKPKFFRDRDLYQLEQTSGLPVRVAYAGLWGAADREGRFVWRPWDLKLDILPYDDLDFEDVLAALEQAGYIVRYTVDGETYGHIPTFLRHQSINQREAQSVIPAPPDGAAPEPPAKHVQETAPPVQEEKPVAEVQVQAGERTGSSCADPMHAHASPWGREGKGKGIGIGKEPPLPPLGDVGESLLVADLQPWFEIDVGTTASRIAKLIVTTKISGGKVPYTEEHVPRDRAERVAAYWDRLACDDEQFEELEAGWRDHHAGKRKAPYTDPIMALRGFVERREVRMTEIKKSRERTAKASIIGQREAVRKLIVETRGGAA